MGFTVPGLEELGEFDHVIVVDDRAAATLFRPRVPFRLDMMRMGDLLPAHLFAAQGGHTHPCQTVKNFTSQT